MGKRVLVTGGAGFIGSHIVDLLLSSGYEVRVYDCLLPQVHGPDAKRPSYLNPQAEFVQGDIKDRAALVKALDRVEIVSHQAAAVGVAQSMYEVQKYVTENSLGVSVLLDILANERHSVKRLVVAASNTLYGEGEYECPGCGRIAPQPRPEEQLALHHWEMHCPTCGRVAAPAPTPESKPLCPTSIYAITKRDHEEMCMCVGRAYGIGTIALRYFNVYGPRQALSNPYAGVGAVYCARLLNGNPPVVYEDGLQTRDFVNVKDIARANKLAIESDVSDEVFNVGTGRPLSILELANILIAQLGFDGAAEVSGQYRQGDIRHCYADVSKIKSALGFEPQVKFEDGVSELVAWVKQQTADDSFDKARRELDSRGLTH